MSASVENLFLFASKNIGQQLSGRIAGKGQAGPFKQSRRPLAIFVKWLKAEFCPYLIETQVENKLRSFGN
jgi:hypothetical protein